MLVWKAKLLLFTNLNHAAATGDPSILKSSFPHESQILFFEASKILSYILDVMW